VTKQERIDYRKKNIIGYEDLFHKPRRYVLGVWIRAIEAGMKASEELAMMVMTDTQEVFKLKGKRKKRNK
jgi:hypothetical protein